MADQFINIPGLVPEQLRDEPLLKDVIEALEHIYYVRKENVAKQLEDIRDKYATYLVLARQPAYDVFTLPDAPAYGEIVPTVYMDTPLIKRERVELSFGVGTFQFIAPALSMEPISAILEGEAVTSIIQISDVQAHMQEGYFEENCLYEITTYLPVALSYMGLSHGQPVPIQKIEDPTLGLLYDSYNLRESTLYALEPDFPYHVYAEADGFEWTLHGKRHDQQELDISRARNSQVVSEFGYQYLLDALGMTPLDVALIRSFITAIHWLKGSRKGVNLMLDLLELNDYVQLFEWWEDDPTGETVEMMSYRVEVDLRRDNIKFRGDALQALRLFMRQYVYPLMSDFALHINFIDERLKTAVNALTFQTLEGTVNTPVVVAPKLRIFQSQSGSITSPMMLAVNGLTEREYSFTAEDVKTEYSFEMAGEELQTALNVLPRMDIPGSIASPVLLGASGISHSRFRGAIESPVMFTAMGTVDREYDAVFTEYALEELSVDFSVNIASGTQGFVTQDINSYIDSPALLLLWSTTHQEYDGTVTGDINDAPAG